MQPQNVWPAVLYAPGSVAGQPVKVSLDRKELKIVAADAHERVYAHRQLAVPEYIAGAPLTVRLPDQHTLELPDGKLARQMAAKSGRALAFFERNLLLIVALLLIASTVPYALHKLALPKLTPGIVEHISVDKIERLEDSVFAQLVSRGFFEVLAGDEYIHQNDLITSRGRRLIEGIEGSEFSYEFLLVSGKHFGANAFALPGGRVLITDELLELLDEDQLTGVLAHEIAHIELRHSLNAIISSSVFGGLMLLIMGDIWSVILPSAISDLAYSREHELAADCQSAHYLAAAGFDPELIGSALEELLGDAPSFYKYLSTHPDLTERKENIIGCASAAAGESG